MEGAGITQVGDNTGGRTVLLWAGGLLCVFEFVFQLGSLVFT